jgi:hypothetical protein
MPKEKTCVRHSDSVFHILYLQFKKTTLTLTLLKYPVNFQIVRFFVLVISN